MKDRIRQIMEAKHLTQQNFASLIGISTASLSSIFNDRTKPTLNTVGAIKNTFPDISTDWLLYGVGSMTGGFQQQPAMPSGGVQGQKTQSGTQGDLSFPGETPPTSESASAFGSGSQQTAYDGAAAPTANAFASAGSAGASSTGSGLGSAGGAAATTGTGFASAGTGLPGGNGSAPGSSHEPLLAFDDFSQSAAQQPVAGYAQPAARGLNGTERQQGAMARPAGVMAVREARPADKPQRKITEIRIFYDDQTWETFVPKK